MTSTIDRLLLMLIVGTVTSCAIPTAHFPHLQGQYDKRLERLQKERDKLTRLTDPVDRSKTDINISEILLSLAGDAVKSGEPEVLGKRLNEYVDAIRDAHQSLTKNRAPRSKPKGFKEFEIALRRQINTLKDLSNSVGFDQREPVDRAKEEASEIRDDIFKALFGEQNAPSRKS